MVAVLRFTRRQLVIRKVIAAVSDKNLHEGIERVEKQRCTLFNARQTVFPKLVEEDSGFDVAQAIFGDFAEAAGGEHGVHVGASDAVAFRRFDPKSLAIKIEVEFSRGAVAAADAVKGKLL